MLGYENRWRKAVASAVAVHLCIFVIFGFAVGRLFAIPANAEHVIELALLPDAAAAATPSDKTFYEPPGNANAELMVAAPAEKAIEANSGMSDHAANPPGRSDKADLAASAGGAVSVGNNKTATPSGKSGGIHAPGILARVEPTYPAGARQADAEGTVVLRVQILENGRPGIISIARSAGDEHLDAAAADAIRQWLFIPAKEQDSGKPITCFTTIPITFRLNN
jgi:protein TonB